MPHMSLNMSTQLLDSLCAGATDQNLLGDLGLDFDMDDLDDLDGLMTAPPAAKKPAQKTEAKSGALRPAVIPMLAVLQRNAPTSSVHVPAPQTPSLVRLIGSSAADWCGSILAAGTCCHRPAKLKVLSMPPSLHSSILVANLLLLFPAGSDWNGTSLLRDSAQHTSNTAEHEDDVMGPDRTDVAEPGAEALPPAAAPEVSAKVPAGPEDGHQQQQLLQEEQLQMQLEGEAAGDSGAVLGHAGDAGGAGVDGISR
jgi:hypothetical protein